MHFAKKLIDETSLPMNRIADASGFGSVRRFNAGIRKFYHRTPTQIRHLARQKEIQPTNQYVFRLNFRPPYDWLGVLDFLTLRCTPGVEAVEAGHYRRTISVGEECGYFEVSLDEDRHVLVSRIEFADPRWLFMIVERIRAMFDLNADWLSISETLQCDPILAEKLQTHPGRRIVGCWDAFELAIRAILGQQVSVKTATALSGRIANRFGKLVRGPDGLTRIFPKPAALADAKLGSVGLTATRAQTIRSLARAVCDGKISFTGLIDPEELVDQLCEIHGIGKWTAQYVCMRAIGQPDSFPSTDLGLLRALSLSSTKELERRAERWRPWRAYAAMYLWESDGPKGH
jgi:AraC family transcriptional regulator of adaptative response / DNA-3-methyladenine glycosylase II